MTDKKYLLLRHQTWFVRLPVPRSLRSVVGKTHIVKTLASADLRVARQRRDEAVAEIRRAFRDLQPEASWSGPVDIAKDLRAKVSIGNLSKEQAVAAFEHELWSEAARSPDLHTVPDGPIAEGLSRGLRIVSGEEQGLTLSEALDKHLAMIESRVVATSLARRRRHTQELQRFLQDPALVSIRRADVARYITDQLMLDGRSPKTHKDVLSDIRAFFQWTMTAGMIESNPADHMMDLLRGSTRGVTEVTRRAWDDGDLSALLDNMTRTLKADDYMHVLVKVAMYSGMRFEEICQLRGRDIHGDCLHIREGKTAAAVRVVPIHSAIRDLTEGLGADDYLIKGPKAAGPDKKRSMYPSQRFGDLKRKWGFESALVFHGLRASFITKMESAGVAVNVAESIVGHARQSMSFGLYSRGADLEVLRDAVERVRYQVVQ